MNTVMLSKPVETQKKSLSLINTDDTDLQKLKILPRINTDERGPAKPKISPLMNADYPDPHGFKTKIYVFFREMHLSWVGAIDLCVLLFLIRDNPRQSAVRF